MEAEKMFDWLGISAVNPLLLWGSAAVVLPVVIHLLSKRRFKVVDWAAMDFLLEADRRNRRRVRLEHLILLLLRCLVIVGISFLVARLFTQQAGLAGLAMGKMSTQRIVVLDDSPSMGLRVGNSTVFDNAIHGISEFVRNTAGQRPGDTFTLILSSRAGRPVINGKYIEQADEIISVIEKLSVSDVASDMGETIISVNRLVSESAGSKSTGSAGGAGGVTSRGGVVYVVSDMRKRDWAADPSTPEEDRVGQIIKRLGEKVEAIVLVDVGSSATVNCTIESIATEAKNLIAGVPARFGVTVVNYGQVEVNDLKVRFTSDDALPVVKNINRLVAGDKQVVWFTFTFNETGSKEIRVEIDSDQLPVDDVRYFAGRVKKGVKVLLVDGDTSSEFGRAETFFLSRALRPPGDALSGNVVEVVTENQFQSIDVSDYQVIFLCNVFQVTDLQRKALGRWVENGGGLIVCLGDQVDGYVYNDLLFDNGHGLLPVKLNTVAGDLSQRTWANFDGGNLSHRLMGVFDGPANPFLTQVKFIQWWEMSVPRQLIKQGEASIVATFNDADNSPAIVERSLGKGRVVVLASSIDSQWNNWPSDPSYVISMLELVNYTSATTSQEGNSIVGRRLIWPLDISRFNSQASVLSPGRDSPSTIHGVLMDQTDQTNGSEMVLEFDQTDRSGMYQMQLSGYQGTSQRVSFAVNIDPSEGDLAPVDLSELRKNFSESNVEIADGLYLAGGASGGRVELWRFVLVGLVVLLFVEQFAACMFGRRR